MKKMMAFVLALICVMGLVGCGKQTPERTKTIEGNIKTYHEMSDGTWECDGHIYKYRLEIKDTLDYGDGLAALVYLSNIENISVERARLASGISSDLRDGFAVEDAVLVEWIQTGIEYDEANAPND